MRIEDAYNQFMHYKMSYCAAASIKFYFENLTKFINWLHSYNAAIVDTSDISKDIYISYLLYLRSLDIKNVTVNTYIRPVKVFCRWLYDEDLLDTDVTFRVKYPRNDARLVLPLSSDEVIRLDSCFDLNSYLGLRNYCIVHLMLDMGLRSGAVVKLKKKDIADNYNYICVNNDKFNKSRFVPLPAFLKEKLILLCAYSPSNYVFLDRYIDSCITSNTIKQLFADLKRDASIDRLHAHLLRHTFATSFVYYGGNLEMCRLLLGHADYAITQNYLHIASQALITHVDIYKIDDCFFKLGGAFNV